MRSQARNNVIPLSYLAVFFRRELGYLLLALVLWASQLDLHSVSLRHTPPASQPCFCSAARRNCPSSRLDYRSGLFLRHHCLTRRAGAVLAAGGCKVGRVPAPEQDGWYTAIQNGSSACWGCREDTTPRQHHRYRVRRKSSLAAAAVFRVVVVWKGRIGGESMGRRRLGG